MSYHWFLYRCADRRPFTRWSSNPADLADRIGEPAPVWQALQELLPTLVREPRFENAAGWYGHATLPDQACAFDLSTTLRTDGAVSMIVAEHRAPPSVLGAIMQRFGLDACCSSHGELRDPHACDDDWRPLAQD